MVTTIHIDEILRFAPIIGSSDVHLTIGKPPSFRVNGRLVPVTELIDHPEYGDYLIGAEWMQILKPPKTKELVEQILPRIEQIKKLEEGWDVDTSHSIPTVGRFRVNIFHQRGQIGIVARLLPFEVPSFHKLGLPPILQRLTQLNNGLVLVTGPPRSGKSSTLGAMIDLINETEEKHIITLEDPIEFLHNHKRSTVNQREIGVDVKTFAEGVRSALRQDPDIILVGELRDPETISIGISAANLGRLVYATLHTNDAAQTVERILDNYPPEEQGQIRIQLSTCLQAIVSQQLIPSITGQGYVLAQEILIATPAIRNLIRENKTNQIHNSILTGADHGMQTMDNAINTLYQRGFISREDAVQRMKDPKFHW